MPLSRLRLIFLTLLLAAVAAWFTEQQKKTEPTTSSLSDQELPYSWQTQQTTVWNLSADNNDQQTIIEAKTFVYQESNQHSEFTEPHLQLITPNSHTQLTSKSGYSEADNKITFTKEVVVDHTGQQTTENTQLKTESLTYHRDSNRITTDEKVTISQYNGQTIGTGLEVDLNNSEYKLLSNVKGQYQLKEPQ